MTCVQRFLDDENGDAAIQYALVAFVLGLVVLAGSLALREPLVDLYASVGDQTNDVLAVEPAAGPN
jgi:Flp pilus assembly pilin Flp